MCFPVLTVSSCLYATAVAAASYYQSSFGARLALLDVELIHHEFHTADVCAVPEGENGGHSYCENASYSKIPNGRC